MPKYRCTVRQDAWIYHACTVEADNAEEAAAAAMRGWTGEDEDVIFTEEGHDGFDNADCQADDCEPVGD